MEPPFEAESPIPALCREHNGTVATVTPTLRELAAWQASHFARLESSHQSLEGARGGEAGSGGGIRKGLDCGKTKGRSRG